MPAALLNYSCIIFISHLYFAKLNLNLSLSRNSVLGSVFLPKKFDFYRDRLAGICSLKKVIMVMFTGTTQKCKACEKTVYVMDELTADNKVYHKACFRCHHCKATLKVILFFFTYAYVCVIHVHWLCLLIMIFKCIDFKYLEQTCQDLRIWWTEDLLILSSVDLDSNLKNY